MHKPQISVAARVSTSTTAPPPVHSISIQVLVVDLDSQRDLTRSLLRANLLAEAAMNGEPPVGVQKYLERDFTPAEVDTYAYTDRGVNDRHFGKKGLARTLEGALDTLTKTDFADVKRVVSVFTVSTLGLVSSRTTVSRCTHGDRHLSVRSEITMS